MYISFTHYINQIQKNQTVATQPKRSNDRIFILKTKTTTVPILSMTSLAQLINIETLSLSSTNNNPFQANTKLNATANPCWTLYQPHTAPNMQKNLPAISSWSSSTVNPMNFSSVNTQNYTVPIVSMNKSVKTVHGLDHVYTSEEYLHRVDAHMMFTMRKELLDLLAYSQWPKEKMESLQGSLSAIALSWFLRFNETYKNDWSAFVYAFEKQIIHRKLQFTPKLKLRF